MFYVHAHLCILLGQSLKFWLQLRPHRQSLQRALNGIHKFGCGSLVLSRASAYFGNTNHTVCMYFWKYDNSYTVNACIRFLKRTDFRFFFVMLFYQGGRGCFSAVPRLSHNHRFKSWMAGARVRFLPKETQLQPGIDPGHRTWNLAPDYQADASTDLATYCP